MSEQLEQALALLGNLPLADDAEQQLESLEAQAPSSEEVQWAMVWEGFEAAKE